jgi:hypothetical protein
MSIQHGLLLADRASVKHKLRERATEDGECSEYFVLLSVHRSPVEKYRVQGPIQPEFLYTYFIARHPLHTTGT